MLRHWVSDVDAHPRTPEKLFENRPRNSAGDEFYDTRTEAVQQKYNPAFLFSVGRPIFFGPEGAASEGQQDACF